MKNARVAQRTEHMVSTHCAGGSIPSTRSTYTLFPAPLFHYRRVAHIKFDAMWRIYSSMTRMPKKEARARAYSWLSQATGIPEMNCHMAQMSIDQCRMVIALIDANNTDVKKLIDLSDFPVGKVYNGAGRLFSRSGRRKKAWYKNAEKAMSFGRKKP